MQVLLFYNDADNTNSVQSNNALYSGHFLMNGQRVIQNDDRAHWISFQSAQKEPCLVNSLLFNY